MPKHTPGPWSTSSIDNWVIWGPNREKILGAINKAANRRLIAAAPELLKIAYQVLVEDYCNCAGKHFDLGCIKTMAKNAIAKAGGTRRLR